HDHDFRLALAGFAVELQQGLDEWKTLARFEDLIDMLHLVGGVGVHASLLEDFVDRLQIEEGPRGDADYQGFGEVHGHAGLRPEMACDLDTRTISECFWLYGAGMVFSFSWQPLPRLLPLPCPSLITRSISRARPGERPRRRGSRPTNGCHLLL